MSQSLKSRLLPATRPVFDYPYGGAFAAKEREWQNYFAEIEKNIDALEAEAVPVYGVGGTNWTSDIETGSFTPTHSALLINIQPIVRGVDIDDLKTEVSKITDSLRADADLASEWDAINAATKKLLLLIERLERHGVKT